MAQDLAIAVQLYQKSAEQGLARAQAALGAMYIKGEGVPRDPATAVKWIEKAAAQGDLDAKRALEILTE